MKKLFTFVVTMLLGAGLSLAQATGGSTATDKTPKAESGKKATKTTTKTKAHKGGKKSKKNSGGTTTPPPK
jgi:hypothetical protein